MSIDTFQLNDAFFLDFTVSDPATGAAINPDSVPSIEIYEDGSTISMLSPVPTRRDIATTGQYSFYLAVTAANGFDVGKTYNIYAIAVVGGTTGKTVVSTFRVSPVVIYAR